MKRFVLAIVAIVAFTANINGTAHGQDDAAGCLVAPWDADDGRVTFNHVTNTSSTDVVLHWTYWSASCEKLIDVTTCATPNGGTIQDTTGVVNRDWIDGTSVVRGDAVDLRVAADVRGVEPYGTVYVSAFEADDDCRSTGVLVDDSIVGVSTVADIPTGVGAGITADGFGVVDGRCVVPNEVIDAVTVQTFAPNSLAFSAIYGHVTAEDAGGDADYPGELGPACGRRGLIDDPCAVVAQVDYADNNEVNTSLGDAVFGCAIRESLLDGVTSGFTTGGTFRFTQPVVVPSDLTLDSYPLGTNGTTGGVFAIQGLDTFGAGHRGWRKVSPSAP